MGHGIVLNRVVLYYGSGEKYGTLLDTLLVAVGFLQGCKYSDVTGLQLVAGVRGKAT
jgi:hypothetical protein